MFTYASPARYIPNSKQKYLMKQLPYAFATLTEKTALFNVVCHNQRPNLGRESCCVGSACCTCRHLSAHVETTGNEYIDILLKANTTSGVPSHPLLSSLLLSKKS